MSETEGNLLKQKKREKKSVEKIIEEYNKGERNFSNLDLRGQSFAGYNLSGANFTGCNLRGADFTGCDLKGTNFRRARMVKAILHDIKAGSENDRTTYTWFFAFLLFAAYLTMNVIKLLVFSREGEIDLINNDPNDFFSLALLIPVGYLIHLSQSQGNIAVLFWVLGILAFWLKTFNEPLWGLFGNLLFWGLAVSLLSPIYRFSMSKSWRSLGQLFQNFPVLIILSFLSVCCVLFSFLSIDILDLLEKIDFPNLLSLLKKVDFLNQLDLPQQLEPLDESNLLLILSSITFNLPVISLLFLSLAAYSTLFDANNRETYINIFKAFFRLRMSIFAFSLASSWSTYLLNSVASDIYYLYLIISILVIPLQLYILFKLWQLIKAKKIRILKCLFWVSSILFWVYFLCTQNNPSNLFDSDLTIFKLKVFDIITFIVIVWLFSLLVLSNYNFASLSLRSERSAKWLGWWFFINLVLPTNLIFFGFSYTPYLDWNINNWLLFFVLTISVWLIFLLPGSFLYIHKFMTWLKARIKKKLIYQFLDFLGLILFVLFTSCLVANSITIIIFFIDWLQYGQPNSYFLEFYIYSIIEILPSVFVLFVLSFVSWLILIFTKNKIAEAKQQSFQLQKIKSQYSIFRDLAVSFRCINSTNFGEANLTEADFSGAEFTSVNFRGAKLDYAIWTQVKGLECVATGNTYLKYPKVRNWVVQVKNNKIVDGDIRNGIKLKKF
ncbi:pentapeptide repeat-containing protein [Dapis sp. BLCC M126]|uniref:pentapeptide repeat-containing protein n=1 Tax=Dapis sp. BLCC M126 TaxID=3400189 RepID=UPI003CE845F4